MTYGSTRRDPRLGGWRGWRKTGLLLRVVCVLDLHALHERLQQHRVASALASQAFAVGMGYAAAEHAPMLVLLHPCSEAVLCASRKASLLDHTTACHPLQSLCKGLRGEGALKGGRQRREAGRCSRISCRSGNAKQPPLRAARSDQRCALDSARHCDALSKEILRRSGCSGPIRSPPRPIPAFLIESSPPCLPS